MILRTSSSLDCRAGLCSFLTPRFHQVVLFASQAASRYKPIAARPSASGMQDSTVVRLLAAPLSLLRLSSA